jgi:hypothetical protein
LKNPERLPAGLFHVKQTANGIPQPSTPGPGGWGHGEALTQPAFSAAIDGRVYARHGTSTDRPAARISAEAVSGEVVA